MTRKKILHLTTVHPRFDVRIFHKELKSLAKKYQVALLVADGLGDEVVNEVAFIDIGKPKNRWSRVFFYPLKVFYHAMKHHAQLYHFHDPELMLVGLLLRLFGKKVIYDVHEHVPETFFLKTYMPKPLRYLGYCFSSLFEWAIAWTYSGIIVVTERLFLRFLKMNSRVVIVANYPSRTLVAKEISDKQGKYICYAGGITADRGIAQVLDALDDVDCRFLLAGAAKPKCLAKLKQHRNWNKVDFLGILTWEQVFERLYSKASIGLLTMLPAPNTNDALPIKLFEYMACGLPVIASNIPLWKKIVESSNCGRVVDPLNPKELSAAINAMLADQNLQNECAKNGCEAILENFNWESQEKNLLSFYDDMI